MVQGVLEGVPHVRSISGRFGYVSEANTCGGNNMRKQHAEANTCGRSMRSLHEEGNKQKQYAEVGCNMRKQHAKLARRG